ncbi:hypothetical protein PGT21_006242 [Puccinia graminis f. sp. tritici]|uniref:Uncharacterized protein n=1 Tax=Puccinia graminis f. sp. tritici TaxID=56615 RepID=A0A5B0Q250_PUCGR|nr:hypothetical protein PGT21_006242 [Puccinia graminis f. sp. tritici]
MIPEDPIGTPSIPGISYNDNRLQNESFQCRGLEYDPEQRWSNPIPREPIVWASRIKVGPQHKHSLHRPGTVASDSDESFQCRGLQWQYEPDLRPARVHFALPDHDRVAEEVDTPETSRLRLKQRPRIRTSHSNVEAFHSKAGLTMAHKSRFQGFSKRFPTSHSSVEASHSERSPSTAAACHIRSLSELRRPDPQTYAPHTRDSAGAITRKNHGKGKNYLGLRLDLSAISNFQLQETDSGRGQGLNETQALNQKSSVDPLALPLTASPPARPAETSLTQAAVPIFGSSKLRTLKLERKNRRKGPLQGIKTALKRFLRVPKRD